jgi:hypothetical protein
MEVAGTGSAHHEGDDGESFAGEVSQDLDARHGRPGLDGSRDEIFLASANQVYAHGLLYLEDQPSTHRFHDRWSATLFPMFGVTEVAMLLSIDVSHRATAHDIGH